MQEGVDKVGEAVESETTTNNRRKLFGEALKDIFPFAHNPIEFCHQVIFLTKNDDYRTKYNDGIAEKDSTTATPEFI